MKPHELIKKVHHSYSQCKSYQDSASCSLTIALPDIKTIEELINKVGTLQHEYKRDKIFDMRWEWLPGNCPALSYAPGTFSASLGGDESSFDITATQNLKANLLHGILSMETEEDIFLIKRLIFFGEAEFWLEDFYEWTVGQATYNDRNVYHLHRIDRGLGDADIDAYIDPDTFTLVSYESNSRTLFEKCLAGSEEEREESREMLFGDEPGPVAVVQKYDFKNVKITH
ncbi:MAG: hypothetical protein JSS83_04275 [Cyanobacteria bacterium SZAS LIN-3]|nr:hypothetical protein [Cyanobacteria bacterium SZAS LIN-3]MBS2008988.1 hypothetical protein [Cyanobacteria bacterium SZAS TMP-1]